VTLKSSIRCNEVFVALFMNIFENKHAF